MATYVVENPVSRPAVVEKNRYFDTDGTEITKRPVEGIVVRRSFPGTARPFEARYIVPMLNGDSGQAKRSTRAGTVEEAVKNMVEVIKVLKAIPTANPAVADNLDTGKIVYHGKDRTTRQTRKGEIL